MFRVDSACGGQVGSQRFAYLAGLTILIGLPNAAEARGIGVHLEGGFGRTVVRPLEREGAPGATACAGLSARLVGSLRAGLEFAATAGGDWPGAMYIPEASRPGDRTLTTFLLGVEMTQRHDGHGPFAFLGAGAGHATLRNALCVFEPPYEDRWIIPSRTQTAFAFGAGTGYRFGGGPGPLRLQFALRAHALANAGQIPASAFAVTMGLAY